MNRFTFVAVSLVVLFMSASLLAQEDEGQKRMLRPGDLKAMSLEEMQGKGTQYLEDMRKLVDNVLDGLKEARASGDPQAVKCVNNALTTIKGLLRLSEQNGIGLRENVIANDRTRTQHEFVKLTIARNKMIELHAQAKGCGGPDAEMMFEGDVVVEKLFDDDLPFEVVRAGLDLPIMVLDMPPSSSPFF